MLLNVQNKTFEISFDVDFFFSASLKVSSNEVFSTSFLSPDAKSLVKSSCCSFNCSKEPLASIAPYFQTQIFNKNDKKIKYEYIVEHQNFIGTGEKLELVRDQKHCFFLQKSWYALAEQVLTNIGVDGRQWVV